MGLNMGIAVNIERGLDLLRYCQINSLWSILDIEPKFIDIDSQIINQKRLYDILQIDIQIYLIDNTYLLRMQQGERMLPVNISGMQNLYLQPNQTSLEVKNLILVIRKDQQRFQRLELRYFNHKLDRQEMKQKQSFEQIKEYVTKSEEQKYIKRFDELIGQVFKKEQSQKIGTFKIQEAFSKQSQLIDKLKGIKEDEEKKQKDKITKKKELNEESKKKMNVERMNQKKIKQIEEGIRKKSEQLKEFLNIWSKDMQKIKKQVTDKWNEIGADKLRLLYEYQANNIQSSQGISPKEKEAWKKQYKDARDFLINKNYSFHQVSQYLSDLDQKKLLDLMPTQMKSHFKNPKGCRLRLMTKYLDKDQKLLPQDSKLYLNDGKKYLQGWYLETLKEIISNLSLPEQNNLKKKPIWTTAHAQWFAINVFRQVWNDHLEQFISEMKQKKAEFLQLNILSTKQMCSDCGQIISYFLKFHCTNILFQLQQNGIKLMIKYRYLKKSTNNRGGARKGQFPEDVIFDMEKVKQQKVEQTQLQKKIDSDNQNQFKRIYEYSSQKFMFFSPQFGGNNQLTEATKGKFEKAIDLNGHKWYCVTYQQ